MPAATATQVSRHDRLDAQGLLRQLPCICERCAPRKKEVNTAVLAMAKDIPMAITMDAAAIGTARTSSHRLHSNAIAQSSGSLARDGHYSLQAVGKRCNYL
jgi:hypothetical protein